MMYAYFPIEWNFGAEPNDGHGGPAVTDAGAIYIARDEECEEDWEPVDPQTIVLKTTLMAIIEDYIDGAQSIQNKLIQDDHIPPAEALRDALLAAAARLDAAIDKATA